MAGMKKFSIRDLLWLVLVVALACGLWRERSMRIRISRDAYLHELRAKVEYNRSLAANEIVKDKRRQLLKKLYWVPPAKMNANNVSSEN